jgi:hypothetical protein
MRDKRKSPWPRTDPERLETIPQFEPDYSFQVHDIDWDNGTVRPFAPDRENLIDGVLKSALPTRIKPTAFEDKPTSAGRYCDYAKHAIAVFEHRKKASAQSNRRQARAELESAVASVLETQQKLERLAGWPEISAYLKSVYVSCVSKPKFEPEEMDESIKRRHERAVALSNEYRNFSPDVLSARLAQLEPVLSLSIEKIEFGPGGDALRDDISQEFCNEMAYAWILGTGQIPTYPKPNPKSRKLSLFASLLKNINDEVLPIELRNQNGFQYFGIQAVDQMRKRFPGFAKVRRRSGSTRR